jgi:hypothetical protein
VERNSSLLQSIHALGRDPPRVEFAVRSRKQERERERERERE